MEEIESIKGKVFRITLFNFVPLVSIKTFEFVGALNTNISFHRTNATKPKMKNQYKKVNRPPIMWVLSRGMNLHRSYW